MYYEKRNLVLGSLGIGWCCVFSWLSCPRDGSAGLALNLQISRWPDGSFGVLDVVNLRKYTWYFVYVRANDSQMYPLTFSGGHLGHQPRDSGGRALILVVIGTRPTVSV